MAKTQRRNNRSSRGLPPLRPALRQVSNSSAMESITVRYTNNVQAPKDVNNVGWIVPVAPWAAYFESLMAKDYRYVKLNWLELNVVPNNKFGHPSQIVAWVDDCTTKSSVTTVDGGLVTMTWSQAKWKSSTSSSDGIRLRCSPNARWMSNLVTPPQIVDLSNSMAEMGVGWFGSAALDVQTVAQVVMVINVTLKDPTGFDKLSTWTGIPLPIAGPVSALSGVAACQMHEKRGVVNVVACSPLTSAQAHTLADTSVTTHLQIGGHVSPELKAAFSQKKHFNGHVDDQKVYGTHVVEPVAFEDELVGATPGILYDGSSTLIAASAYAFNKDVTAKALGINCNLWVVDSCASVGNCSVTKYDFPTYQLLVRYVNKGIPKEIFRGAATDVMLDCSERFSSGGVLTLQLTLPVSTNPTDFPARVISGVHDLKEFVLPRLTLHGLTSS